MFNGLVKPPTIIAKRNRSPLVSVLLDRGKQAGQCRSLADDRGGWLRGANLGRRGCRSVQISDPEVWQWGHTGFTVMGGDSK